MPNTSWKKWERLMGVWTNRTRSGPLGQNRPDLESSSSTSLYPYPVEIECKEMAKISLKQQHIDQARNNARGNAWAIAYKEKVTGRKFVLMDAEQWAELLRLAESGSLNLLELQRRSRELTKVDL